MRLALHPANTRNQPGRRTGPVVHPVGGEKANLQKGRTGVDQPVNPFAGEELAPTLVRPCVKHSLNIPV